MTKRLIEIGQKQSMNPGCSYSGAAKGSWSEVKGYYRFIEQPDDSGVTMENILAPHREQTIRRMKAERTVLAIQDGSDLNFNNLTQCEGLGLIASNQTGAKSFGLHLHSSFAVNTSGLPLGVLRSRCSAPKPKSYNSHASKVPIEEKRLFPGLKACAIARS